MREGKRSQVAVFVAVFVLLFVVQGLFYRPGSTSVGPKDFWLEAWSSCQYSFECNAHDILHGELEVKQDGDLFPGDQTKYDIWLIEGVNILVCNQTNYELWLSEQEATGIVNGHHVSSLSWRIEVPQSGRWYVTIYSDSIFRKHLQISISQDATLTPFSLILIGSVAALSALTVTFVLRLLRARSLHGVTQPKRADKRRPEAAKPPASL